jgi:WD40 repeat protein
MSETPDDNPLDEVLAAYLEAVDAGWAPQREAFLARYPALRGELEAFFAAQEEVGTLSAAIRADTPPAPRPLNGDATKAIDGAAPAAAPAPRSFGDYELLEEIARGGMGVVFKARRVSLGRVVALKMILSGDLASAGEVQRFRNEAEAAALMDHPNIVPIYDVGEHGGWHYFSMRLVEGGSLAQLLGRGEWTLGTKDDCRRAGQLVATAARAVHYAHQRGILHRDLKPANVLLGEQGEPLVTDFGLAKRLDEGAGLTVSGAIVGTPGYMAPEQAAGKHRELTTAADVYSLGAVLYELLTGRPPFKCDNVLDTLLQVREAKPVRPWALNPRVDADLETICLKCLEKEPERRYASAEALADDLERWQHGEPVRARRTGFAERTWKWARRRPGLALMTGFVAVCLALTLGFGVSYETAAARLRDTALQKDQAERSLAQESQQRAEESRLRAEAQQARTAAERAGDRAEAALYSNRVTLAQLEWQANAVARADQLLEACPPTLRGWEWRYVKRLCHADLLSIYVGGPVCDVCFSADGRRLAGALQDRTVRVWDAATGHEILSREGHDHDPARGVCFSPDGRHLASNSYNTVKVWDVATGRESLSLKAFWGHNSIIGPRGWHARRSEGAAFVTEGGVRFSPDGKRLASPSGDHKVRVWDAATGREAATPKGQTSQVYGVSFGPDGRRLAGALQDGTVKVWDAATGEAILSFKGHAAAVLGVCFSPDGKRLASASEDKTVQVWDAATGRPTLTLKGHTGAVLGACFSPDGQRLASASYDRTLKVWDATTGQELLTLKGHTDYVRSVCFDPSGKYLASASGDGTVKVWDAATNQEAVPFNGHAGPVYGVCFSPDGRRLAGAFRDRTVKVWDVATGRKAFLLNGHSGLVAAVAFSPDGQYLASASWDKTVQVWDAATGRALTPRVHSGAVHGVCFSPDGLRLASASGDKTVRVWDAVTGRVALTLNGHTDLVWGVCFSPDGQRLASASEDRTVKVWDAATGQIERTLEPHAGAARSVCFSGDGRRLMSALDDGTVKVWDAATGQEALTLRDAGPVYGACFSPDGKRLASACDDETVKVWDAATGQEVLSLKGHTGPVVAVAFSPDGRRLASASEDGTVKVWDATPPP